MRKFKFDIGLMESNCNKTIYLEWFATFGVDHHKTVWLLDEKHLGRVKALFKAEDSGRELYTNVAYFRPVITNTELSQWM